MVSKGRTVYSTRSGDLRKQAPPTPPQPSLPPGQQTARIALDKRHRSGKQVTVISGLVLSEVELAELGRRLKVLCGAGGTVKDGQIEIQGDHRERVAAELQALGYRTKRVGG